MRSSSDEGNKRPVRHETVTASEQVDTVIIGGGQAGLAAGYHLQREGLPFVILDAEARTGDVWRRRWDSLRLFTPAAFSSLPGMRLPAAGDHFASKDEFADYLESYAEHFALPVRHDVRVDRLSRAGERFLVDYGTERIAARQVVVAMATYQRPKVPAFAAHLDNAIVQLHSSEYRGPGQLPRDGTVLVVGAGNSGAEIALELSQRQPVLLAGRHPGQIPFDIASPAGHAFLTRLVLRVLFHRILSAATPIGRKVRTQISGHAGPLIRTKAKHLKAAGVERVPRIKGVSDGQPVLDNGITPKVVAVVWCTGFRPGFEWIDLPLVWNGDEPHHDSGEVKAVPGLYFLGLHFLYSLSSAMIHGVDRDAARIVRLIASRASTAVDADGGRLMSAPPAAMPGAQ